MSGGGGQFGQGAGGFGGENKIGEGAGGFDSGAGGAFGRPTYQPAITPNPLPAPYGGGFGGGFGMPYSGGFSGGFNSGFGMPYSGGMPYGGGMLYGGGMPYGGFNRFSNLGTPFATRPFNLGANPPVTTGVMRPALVSPATNAASPLDASTSPVAPPAPDAASGSTSGDLLPGGITNLMRAAPPVTPRAAIQQEETYANGGSVFELATDPVNELFPYRPANIPGVAPYTPYVYTPPWSGGYYPPSPPPPPPPPPPPTPVLKNAPSVDVYSPYGEQLKRMANVEPQFTNLRMGVQQVPQQFDISPYRALLQELRDAPGGMTRALRSPPALAPKSLPREGTSAKSGGIMSLLKKRRKRK